MQSYRCNCSRPRSEVHCSPLSRRAGRLKGLRSGAVAVLATASPNFMNKAAGALGFTQPIFYDYQGFLVNKAAGIHSSKDLAGKKVCFLGGTETEMQVQGYMQRQSIRWLPFPFQEEGEMEAAFITGTVRLSQQMCHNSPMSA
nr:ABC transporter substrate-binding protein [Granulicella arctica]